MAYIVPVYSFADVLFDCFQRPILTYSDWPNHILKSTYGFVLISRIYRLVLPIFFDTSFLKNRTSRAEPSRAEPSRAEPSRAFWSKARAKTEPSLGSGATLLYTYICIKCVQRIYVIYFIIDWNKIFQLRNFGWFVNSNFKNMWPICWKHLDGSFSFIEVDWKCINCPLQRTVLQSHQRFNEFSWCGALVKRQKALLLIEKNTWREKTVLFFLLK